MYIRMVFTHCMYRSYDNKVYTFMYREYYKIIIIVLLVGQGGHTKVWYMAPLVLVLVKGMVISMCTTVLYMYCI